MASVSASASSDTAKPNVDVEPSLDISMLKEQARKGLVDALNSVNGSKTLVLDPTLAGPLSLVTEVSLLKHHGVDKMFWLEPGPLSASTTNIVYLCRPLVKWVKLIAEQLKRHGREAQKHTYTLLLVPRTSTLVSRILEEEGVLGDITISSYNLQFIPLAEDVISLENDKALKELWVDGDETVIYNSMQALHSLQRAYGQFPRIVGKGDYATRLANLLHRTPPASDGPTSSQASQAPIDSLIIIDRGADMITPLLTQLTYEGLIDECFSIKNSHVEVPASLLTPPANPALPAAASTSTTPPNPTPGLAKERQKKKHHLTTATDPLLAELRDLNFAHVGRKLNQVARRLDEDYKLRHQVKTTAQLKDFVGKLGGLQSEHQSLRLHTGLSELLVPLTRSDQFNKSLEIQQNLLASYDLSAQLTAIEELIAQGTDMQTVVRLLCLASIVSGGIKAKTLENLKREILQAYGYHLLPLLLSLSAPPLCILLPNPLQPSALNTAAATKYPYSALRKSLRLVIDDPDNEEDLENDISYVYSGYAPISVRLVQCVAQKGGVLSNPAGDRDKKAKESGDGGKAKGPSSQKVQAHPIVGWKGFEDVVASIPGGTVDIVQNEQGGLDGASTAAASLIMPRETPTTTVVFFLGGCTYTEIAALRWVGRQNKGRKFLVATTGIISGASLIEGIAGVERSAAQSKDAAL
ncbi:hypothetical protein FOMPIDRAFT_1046976 [Fomitopsis schrenkii]|uniref:Sec1-like protein n=1 Tax=Fomitopsis schrenkii TaxID=2126942 RepID=S8FYZ6_FOMSC|nr:hypothetical protein FOMPIDRAFT_1046976 [Fomitopsis schrenkii]